MKITERGHSGSRVERRELAAQALQLGGLTTMQLEALTTRNVSLQDTLMAAELSKQAHAIYSDAKGAASSPPSYEEQAKLSRLKERSDALGDLFDSAYANTKNQGPVLSVALFLRDMVSLSTHYARRQVETIPLK
jgi:hypothetical protein